MSRWARSLTRVPWVMVFVVVGALLRLAIGLRPLPLVDRMFIPDDTYYTLAIAKSLSQGLGPTADGVIETNGFQPLLAFLQVPFFWLFSHPANPVRATLVLGALCDAGVIFLLARLARRLGGTPAGIIAAALWAVSPLAIANALNGLETSLSLLLQLGLVLAWWRARDLAAADASSESGGRRRVWLAFGLAGFLAGLALLSRIDSAFLVGALGVFELVRGQRRGTLVAGAVALVVVAPWWLYTYQHLGLVVPESGPAVKQLLEAHRNTYLTLERSIGWAAGTIATAPFWDANHLRDRFIVTPAWSLAAFAALAAMVALSARRVWTAMPARALALHALVCLAFYALYLPAIWFFRRYLASVELVVTLFLALALGRALEGVTAAARVRLLPAVGVVLSVALVLVGASNTLPWLTALPGGSVEWRNHGAKGYLDVAMEVFPHVPPGSTIGALQSGALSYWRPKKVNVVNLDGVVDGVAADAGRRKRLATYAYLRGVTHFADWENNLKEFRKLSSGLPLPKDAFTKKGQAKRQGTDQVSVYEIEWPDEFTSAAPR